MKSKSSVSDVALTEEEFHAAGLAKSKSQHGWAAAEGAAELRGASWKTVQDVRTSLDEKAGATSYV